MKSVILGAMLQLDMATNCTALCMDIGDISDAWLCYCMYFEKGEIVQYTENY